MITQADILNAKILIVDDQAVNVQLLEYLLTTTGYTAVSSTTDPRVVAPWHEQHNYDLIILDLHMPGICLLYTSPSPRDLSTSRMPSSA